MAAALVMALGLTMYLLPQKPVVAEPQIDEVYLRLALLQGDEVDQIDNLVLTGVLQDWYEAGLDVDDILGIEKEDGEPDSFDILTLAMSGR